MTGVRAILVLTLAAAYFSSVFQLRPPLGRGVFSTSWMARPGWTAGLADWLDPYFINGLLEHWYHCLTTFSSPVSPPMFFPARGTLGYSHGLVLFAPYYIVVRPFTDPLLAYTLSLFLVMVVGSCCLYLVCRRLTLNPFEALIVSAFFWTSPNVVSGFTGVWAQSASVFVIPPILLLAMIARDMRDGRPRLALAWLAGLLAALLLIQDFYTAQFALLLIALLLVGVLLLSRVQVWGVVRAVWGAVRATCGAFVEPTPALSPGRVSRAWLIVAGLALALAVFTFVRPIDRTPIGPWRVSVRDPFRPLIVAIAAGAWFAGWRWRLITRLRSTMPAARANASAARASSAVAAPSASAWLAAQRRFVRALLLGGVVGSVWFFWIYLPAYLEQPGFPPEQLFNALWQINPPSWHSLTDVFVNLRRYDGIRPFVLVFMLAALAWVPAFNVPRTTRLYALWVIVVTAIVLVVPFKYGTFSFWKVLFGWMPGLSSLRDPARIIYLYELAVALLVALLLRRLAARSWLRLTAVALVAVLLVWEPSPTVFDFNRDRGDFARYVEAPIAIDPSCRSFFVDRASQTYMARPPGHMWSLYGVDALFISMRIGLPTLNGYSAWGPRNWDLANPPNDDYLRHVAEWITDRDLRDVCRLDLDRRTMTPFHPSNP